MKYFYICFIVIILYQISISSGSKKQGAAISQYSLIEKKVYNILALMANEEKVCQILKLGHEAMLKGNLFIARDTLMFTTNQVKQLIVKCRKGSILNYINFNFPSLQITNPIV